MHPNVLHTGNTIVWNASYGSGNEINVSRGQCFIVETNFSTFENIDLPLIRIGG